MTCPSAADWSDLVAHRFDPERPEPESWRETLDHLDRCEGCRRSALQADPTLLFRPLTAPAPLGDEAEEAAAMSRAVTALRRAERVERRQGRGPRWLRENAGLWGRWAAAALMVFTALSLGAGTWSGGSMDLAGLLGGGLAPAELVRGDLLWGEEASMVAAPARNFRGADSFGPAVDEALSSMPIIEPLEGQAPGENPLIWEGEGEALIWVWDSDLPQDV